MGIVADVPVESICGVPSVTMGVSERIRNVAPLRLTPVTRTIVGGRNESMIAGRTALITGTARSWMSPTAVVPPRTGGIRADVPCSSTPCELVYEAEHEITG